MAKETLEETKEVKTEETKKEEKVLDEFVPRKAYTEVTNDMHKYKSDLKETKAMLNQIKSEQEAAKNAALAEQGRWEELYKKSQGDMETMRAERSTEKDQFISYHKKNSVLQALGGFKRDEYNSFIDTNNISLNEDGSIEKSSLETEITRIRQSYPELIKHNKTTRLPNEAPINDGNIGDKSYQELSEAEKQEYKRKQFKNQKGA